MKNKKKIAIIILISFLAPAATGIHLWFDNLNLKLQDSYNAAKSPRIAARDNSLLFLRPNQNGYYCDFADEIPENVKTLIVKKEDRFFYWHQGINLGAILKNLASYAGFGSRQGSSTISQQLAKILLGQENQRDLKNKIKEIAYTAALETTNDKNRILSEYANVIYFGNRLQGIKTASLAYFNTDPSLLSDSQIFQLLASISDPSGLNPAQEGNIEKAKILAKNLDVELTSEFTGPATAENNLTAYYGKNSSLFELRGYIDSDNCSSSQQTSIDNSINTKLRQIIAKNLKELGTQKAKNAAALIIKLPENQVLALTGSPDPGSSQNGYQINMLTRPRQIGSTIKPFIYLKAFEKGMRPYTLIDDREYKYAAGDFPIYPENYDRTYRGLITAHYALANSINTAAVKTLEFVGIPEFGQFIQKTLGIATQQNYQDYQMGIALGAMETDLISLAQAYTIFPNSGRLENLHLFFDPWCNNIFAPSKNSTIAKKAYIELINKILSDRIIAQDQFSSASDLNLQTANYALKTGTSHDYTDSWVIGYTPDFLVAVWVGNADASAMEGVSGQLGAGRIWNDIMQMMLASDYNKKTSLDFSDVAEYKNENNIEYGLKNDNYRSSRDIILKSDNQLILKPHDKDTYLFDQNTRIILSAKTTVSWTINDQNFGTSQELIFSPPSAGIYTIEAQTNSQKEKISIALTQK